MRAIVITKYSSNGSHSELLISRWWQTPVDLSDTIFPSPLSSQFPLVTLDPPHDTSSSQLSSLIGQMPGSRPLIGWTESSGVRCQPSLIPDNWPTQTSSFLTSSSNSCCRIITWRFHTMGKLFDTVFTNNDLVPICSFYCDWIICQVNRFQWKPSTILGDLEPVHHLTMLAWKEVVVEKIQQNHGNRSRSKPLTICQKRQRRTEVHIRFLMKVTKIHVNGSSRGPEGEKLGQALIAIKRSYIT